MYSLLAQEDEKNKSSIVKSSFITPVSYQTIAFVCGKDIHDSTSIRAKFIQHCTDNHIEITPFLAEDAVEKEPFGLDYLTQEKVIASFSGAIVIAVESFGSACELGTFSYVDSMAKKIYILDEAENLENDSFIKCGPIEKINRLAGRDSHLFSFGPSPTTKIPVTQEEAFTNCANAISVKSTLTRDTISIKDDTLCVNNLYWLRVALLELSALLSRTTMNEIKTILLHLYSCDHLALKFDKETSMIRDDDVDPYLDLLINFSSKLHLLTRDSSGIIISNPLNKFPFSSDSKNNSVLFKTDFANSSSYKRILSRRLLYLRRRHRDA